MRYELVLGKDFAKQFERLDQSFQKRVLIELRELLLNPKKQGVIQLTGETHFRTRVGDYRILFDIDEKDRILTAVRVGHRSEGYDR